jgi:septal ring factor EnvC (AmiA/AmiB activator)
MICFVFPQIKQLEAQLEDEHHEVSQAVKSRNDSERKLMDLRQQLEHLNDNSSGKRYKHDLKSTKALLRDAQQAIDQLVSLILSVFVFERNIVYIQ